MPRKVRVHATVRTVVGTTIVGRTASVTETMTKIGRIDRLFDQEQVDMLLAIVDARSFSAAAAALNMSQPAVSQQIKRMEHVVGRPLFRRTRHGVELTSDGEAVLVYARALSVLTTDLRRQLEGNAQTARIGVGMSEDFCRTALPTVLGVFLRNHPRVDLRVISGSYETLERAIDSNTVDLAVMRRYSRYPQAKAFWTDRLVWYGRRELSLPIGDPVPLVLPIAPNPARDAPMAALRDHGRAWQIRFESVGLAGVEAAMQAGLGVCAGPASMRLHGVVALGERSGLPPLPDVEFVMVGPKLPASDALLAFAEMLERAAASSFQHEHPLRRRRGAVGRAE